MEGAGGWARWVCGGSAGPACRQGRLLPRAPFYSGPHFIMGSFLK